MSDRRRLSADERRRQLVDTGAAAFAAQPYVEVRMDRVADAAGVSRALLYQHFASKNELFVAVYEDAMYRRLEAIEPQARLSLTERVAAGLDTNLDYFAAHRHTILAAYRELAGDPTLRVVLAGEFRAWRDRLLDAPELAGRPREVVGAVIIAWLVFVRTLCVEWLTTARFSRVQVHEICLGAFLGAVERVAAA